MSIRALTEIVRDRVNTTNANRAAECVIALAALPADDRAREDFRTAAQTFALLDIADQIRAAGGLEPRP